MIEWYVWYCGVVCGPLVCEVVCGPLVCVVWSDVGIKPVCCRSEEADGIDRETSGETG